MSRHIAIIGASGAIGRALTEQLAAEPSTELYAFSRSHTTFAAPNITTGTIDITNDTAIEQAAATLPKDISLEMVIVATGMLHTTNMLPEKSLKDISAEAFEQLFMCNTIGPAMVAQHFIPKLHRDRHAIFAALSARVGSISDNQLGGWYSYRASKAALNMVLKTMAIETARRHINRIIVGMHPGTVDSALSKPFQRMVPEGALFTPEKSASHLRDVLAKLAPHDSGKCFAWDGQEIAP